MSLKVGFGVFRVWGLGFRVLGLGFRVWGLGFRVSRSGFDSPNWRARRQSRVLMSQGTAY